MIRYPTPVGATTWGARYALRVSRSGVVILILLPHSSIRRGRPGKASRYAQRVSRSGVVILSLLPHSSIRRGRPGKASRYALRVSRSVVVILSLLPHSGIRRGRPGKASRYALRVSRSGVVILSLSRRNAASESEATGDLRAALGAVPTMLPLRGSHLLTTNHSKGAVAHATAPFFLQAYTNSMITIGAASP